MEVLFFKSFDLQQVALHFRFSRNHIWKPYRIISFFIYKNMVDFLESTMRKKVKI